VTRSEERRAAPQPLAQSPAPSDALVAVLERKGRFLTAAPLFARTLLDGGPRREAAARVVRDGGGRRGTGARAGDLVLVQSDRRGSRIVRVLGRPDVAREAIEALMLDRGLSRAFDAAAEREARAAAERVRTSEEPRRDLRALTTFTIDPVSARDFDDAISAQEGGDGAVRVWVHIADVAAHVSEGSRLDREARRRATSVYVPGAVEPMLPHSLSSDACSLVPGRERAAVTVELELRGAKVVSASFYRSLIRSDARLDYEQVQRVFDGEEQAAEPWRAPLAVARTVAAALERRREQSGALVVESEEPEFAFDEHGNVTSVRGRSQGESHRVIEHLMIAANEAVAEHLARAAVPCLFRVHERPEPARIAMLLDQLASLEVPTPPAPEPMSASQAAELVGEISRLVDKHVRRRGHGRIALSTLVLRSLRQAYYSPRNLGHAGLHSAAYCHFTSPIRRYPDIVCHRALLSTLGSGERAPRAAELDELGAWTSEREREAMEIERDADDMGLCFALQRVLAEGGPEQSFAGEVTGLIPAGAFVAFAPADGAGERTQPPFEGMLPVRLLRGPLAAHPVHGGGRPRRAGRGAGRGGRQARHGRGGRTSAQAAHGAHVAAREWWELNEQGTMLVGERSGATVRLGDPIEVRVERIDPIRGRVDLIAAH
jgi:ribonuclease R